MLTFGVLAPGNLGSSLLSRLSNSSTKPIFWHRREDRCQELEKLGLGKSVSFEDLLQADIIFITVKPNLALEICQRIKPLLEGRIPPIFVSIMAGIPVSFLERELGTGLVIRMMFDLSIGHMMTDVFVYSSLEQNFIREALDILGYIRCYDQEEHLDTITAYVGCGPAFVARLFQAYVKAGISLRFDAEDARKFALRLFERTILMLEDIPEQTLIECVACKGGATERGLQHLQNIEVDLLNCMQVAEKRCQEIREANL